MKLFAVAPALLLLTGCPLLDVEVEVAEVCITYNDVPIEGVPLEALDHVETTVLLDDFAELRELVSRQDVDLRFTRAEIRAVDVPSIGPITSARVVVASGDPESTLPTLTVVECTDNCLVDGTTLAISADVQESALEYVKSASLVVDLDLHGRLPATQWHADIDVCMSGRAGFRLEP